MEWHIKNIENKNSQIGILYPAKVPLSNKWETDFLEQTKAEGVH